MRRSQDFRFGLTIRSGKASSQRENCLLLMGQQMRIWHIYVKIMLESFPCSSVLKR